MDVTYCTGLWLIPGNQKRNDEHYLSLVPQTCRMLAGKRLVLHCEEDAVADRFRNHAASNGIELEVVRTSVSELPFHGYAEDLLQCCKRMSPDRWPKSSHGEKGARHYWRHYLGAGDDTYRQLLAIWLSKIPLAQRLAQAEAEAVAWVDASIARVSGKRTNWDFTKVKPDGHKVQHYASQMYFHGRTLPISAGFLQTNQAGWDRLRATFEDALRERLFDDYAHDEETILSFCHSSEPSMFQTVGRPSLPWKRRVRQLFRRA